MIRVRWIAYLLLGLVCTDVLAAHVLPAKKVKSSIRHLQRQIDQVSQQHQLTLHQQRAVQEQQEQAEQKIGQLLHQLQQLQLQSSVLNTQIDALRSAQLRLHRRVVFLRQELLREDLLIWKASRHDYFQMLLNAQNPADIPVLLHNFRIISEQRAQHMVLLERDVAQLKLNERNERLQLQQFNLSQVQIMQNKTALEQARLERQQALKLLKGQSQSEEARMARLQRHEAQLSVLLKRLLTHPVRPKHPELVRGQHHLAPRNTVATPERSYPPQSSCPLPVAGNLENHFGAERLGGLSWHGVVIVAASGTKVHAVGDGVVVYAGYVRGFGWLVIVQHTNGLMVLYGQNRSVLVKMGQSVEAGQSLAESGDTGDSGIAGVYFEVRRLGHPVDPLRWCHD